MFNEFSIVKLKSEIDVFIRKFLNVFYFPSSLVIVAKSLDKRFMRSSICNYLFSVIVK